MPEGASRSLDAGYLATFGMSAEQAVDVTKAIEFCDRKKTFIGKQRIER